MAVRGERRMRAGGGHGCAWPPGAPAWSSAPASSWPPGGDRCPSRSARPTTSRLGRRGATRRHGHGRPPPPRPRGVRLPAGGHGAGRGRTGRAGSGGLAAAVDRVTPAVVRRLVAGGTGIGLVRRHAGRRAAARPTSAPRRRARRSPRSRAPRRPTRRPCRGWGQRPPTADDDPGRRPAAAAPARRP